MKLNDLLDVIVNGEKIYVFDYDKDEDLFYGQNMEYDKDLQKLSDKKVVFLEAETYENIHPNSRTTHARLRIGVM
ncbi:MAG: hypothetical protein FWE22_03925 [Firmicutes bacterium]|nr:hypothetical protein [Bacillota bacterium]